jgi:hypothetical protein
MMSKLNMKKVAVALACLLLIATPATVAQSGVTVQGTVYCRDGKIVSLVVKIEKPGTYTFRFGSDTCYGRTEAKA